jgi:hypothetical protein
MMHIIQMETYDAHYATEIIEHIMKLQRDEADYATANKLKHIMQLQTDGTHNGNANK